MEEMNLDQQKALAMMAMRQRAADAGDSASGTAATLDEPKTGGWLRDLAATSLKGVTGLGAMFAAPGGGLARNAAAGAGEALTGMGAMMSDPGANEEAGALGLEPATHPETQQHRLNEVAGKIGFNPEDVSATTAGERMARAVGGGAMSGIIPGGGLGLVARTALGAVSGLGGEAAAELSPDALKPIARIAGGLTTGLAGIAAATTVEQAIAAAGRAADRSMGPFTNAAREQVVGEKLANAATDLPAVRASLAGGPDEIVPGSAPTTFQQTGDMGLGGLEREVQTRNPAEFQQRRADQNSARREQLGSLQPAGNAADLAAYVKSRVRWLDEQTEQDVAEATRVAQQRAEGLGGTRTPEEYGAGLRDPLQEARDAAKARERALWSAVDPNGDLTVNAGPVRLEAHTILSSIPRSAKPPTGDEMHILQAASEYGTAIPFSELGALRTSVNDAMRTELRTAGQSQVYGRLSRMRSAIERSINSAVEHRAQEAPDELSAALAGFESRADQWSGTRGASGEGFGTYDATGTGGVSSGRGTNGPGEGRTDSASRNPGISQAPVGRSLFQTIARAGGIRVEDASGNISPEGSVIRNLLQGQARLINNRTGISPDRLRQFLQNEGWFGRTERFGPTALEAGQHPGDSLDEMYDLIDKEARGERVYHPEERAPGQRYDPAQHEQVLEDRGAAAGVPRLHGWSLRDWDEAITEREAMREEGSPTIDDAARARLRAATASTRERADTFDRGPVGQALAKAGRQDQYKLSDASVGLKFFPPGPRGAETVAAYRRAVGDDSALVNLQDYAASSLRRVASNADLTLDPGKVSQWLSRHADAMRAFPELHERFRDATAASEALAEAAATRRTVLDSAQSGALGKVANLDDPEAVTRTVGAIFGAKDSVAQMRELARVASRNPEAREGLRKAVADHIRQKLVSNTEVGASGEAAIKSDQFQTFVRQNRAALSEVFTPEEVGSLEAIAADLQRANRSLNAVKIPGQSNTAQDLLSAKSGSPSILRAAVSDIVTAGTTAAATLTHGFGAGLVALLGTKTIAALRNAGITKTDKLLREAMLNPQVAKALLSKIPETPGPTFRNVLADRMRSALKTSAIGGVASGAAGRREDEPLAAPAKAM